MLYQCLVKKLIRWSFKKLAEGDQEALLKGLHPSFIHHFPGHHALGGSRNSLSSMRRWFKRLFLIFPDLRFDIKNILVRGWPWNTVVAVEWVDRATPQDGLPYENQGVHILRLKWGRVVSIKPYLDTQKIDEVCKRLAEKGLTEAEANPIDDFREF